ncbi:MAG: class I SAM-dependent methyltransferase [Acidobacteriia bacterium]|nr:class I SAM-dependent methyltransferase [Terriglobia bacterium]
MTIPSPSWDERYRQQSAQKEPSGLLVEFARLLPEKGLVLDLACGGGRNSVFLAERGLRVIGVDRAFPALEQGKALAARRGLNVAWLQADLTQLTFFAPAFDVCLVFYYRDPELYPRLRAWLRPGGLLLYETSTREQLRFASGPRNPAHLLEPGELLAAAHDWEILYSREARHQRGIASLVARKPTA